LTLEEVQEVVEGRQAIRTRGGGKELERGITGGDSDQVDHSPGHAQGTMIPIRVSEAVAGFAAQAPLACLSLGGETMKGNTHKPLLLVVAAMLVLVVFTSVANTQGLAEAAKSADKHWSALDKVPRFLEKAEDASFSWQEGKFSFLDLIKEACARRFFCAMGNKPWPNAYFTLQMPNPEEAHYVMPHAPMWQMEQDEAIVIIGQTPPAMRYFSIQTWVQLGPAAVISDTLPVTATRSLIGSAFGDSTNNLTTHTVGPDPFDRPIVYIITGNRTTEQRVRAIAKHAGYPAEVINVEALSTAIAPLGIGPTGSIFVTVQRNAVALVPENVLKEYVERSLIEPPEYPYRAFRLSPEVALAPDPYPVPRLRVHGTGQTEMDLYAAQQRLRQAILARDTVPGRGVKELGARLWGDSMANGFDRARDRLGGGLGSQVRGQRPAVPGAGRSRRRHAVCLQDSAPLPGRRPILHGGGAAIGHERHSLQQ
jgi:hypothetical protein